MELKEINKNQEINGNFRKTGEHILCCEFVQWPVHLSTSVGWSDSMHNLELNNGSHIRSPSIPT